LSAFLALPLDIRLDPANLAGYGKVTSLLDNHRPSIWDGAALIGAFKEAFERERYDPAVDYIILTGKAIYLAVLMVALWEYLDESFPADTGASFLVYDANSCLYKELRLPRARVLQ
jgi:hypothetical protein